MGTGAISPVFIIGIRSRGMASFMPWPLYHEERTSSTHQKLWGPMEGLNTGTDRKLLSLLGSKMLILHVFIATV
jgi:hypothetical protein